MEMITLERVRIADRIYNKEKAYRKGEETDRADYGVSLSPFNMPSVVEIRFSRESRSVNVKFVYANTEPASKEIEEQGVIIRIGENSRKVLDITFRASPQVMAANQPVQIPAKTMELISSKSVGSQRFVFERTAQIANQIMTSHWDELRRHVAKMVKA